MKRLKIVEQIIIVLILAVLIPFTTIGFIINNVSQRSIRYELINSVTMIADFLGNSIENYYKYVKHDIDIKALNAILDRETVKDRDIYVFDNKTKGLIATNAPETSASDALSGLDITDNKKSKIFGNVKNTPKAYYKIDNPDWFIVVDTTKQITKKTIAKARGRIILALSLAAFFIFIMVGLYTYYLYINIRQLFKGITAISKGNYDKKIHLIKRVFTPHEVVFLAKEFNYMANKINVSHKDLRKKNKELQKLNEFRQNLVNSTSHEFRTPLTSIIGYTSRLLRHDIELDEDTRIKSLQTIKDQAQRLSRMVEDLLVIPELESYSLKYNFERVDITSIISRVVDYLKNDNVELISDISPDINNVWADEYRVEQIFVNLVDNAIKYSRGNSPVKIIASSEDDKPIVKIINECEKIPADIKKKLFEKFIRVDSDLTRTTRGTGLGLYIVKGLCEAMQIDIDLKADREFVITLKFNDYVK